jgi:hypothetical protein
MTQYTGKVGSTILSDVSDFTREASANQKTVIAAGSAPVAHLRHCYVTIGGLPESERAALGPGSAPLRLVQKCKCTYSNTSRPECSKAAMRPAAESKYMYM